ncbi:DNA polymerase III subunit beta [Clostridium chromiireducens]|jgi:DNA polymerase III, beta subunit|uniref:Beta sliding clamp n=1 Tax=Clostridium chromiireducens TaxID=225345 RepID=A0A964W1M4_9CLOT|nr:DNA polymerase III subunit beta [Clostridium chromiireducens]MVX63651.1 DNA polymerase III subunit beta [Clostridium chromiireducens]
MKFIIGKANLLDNLNKVSRAITGKASLTALKGVFIQVAKGQIIMLGSDMDLSIFARGTCEVIEAGMILVDAKIFIEIIHKLPEGDITIEKTEDNLVKISCKKSEFRIVRMNETEYPELPKETNGTEIIMPKEVFGKMIGEVHFAIAQDESRPILQGILYEIKDSILRLVALDGYRLALSSNKVNCSNDMSAVIDGKSLISISKLIGSNGQMKLYLHKNHIEFRLDNIIIYSRLLEGQYIKYESLLPQDKSKIEVVINRLEFIEAIERSALIAKSSDTSSNPILKFNILNDGILDLLVVNSKSSMGKVREEITVEILGTEKELEIAFNGRYLLEMLKNMNSEKLIMKVNTPVSPCICHPADSEDSKYLILPVRLTKDF